MALSSLGFSQTSAHSLASLADPATGHPPHHPGERRISFVLHEADAEDKGSNHSSTTTLTLQDEAHKDGEDPRMKKRPSQSSAAGTPAPVLTGATARSHLLRRATGAVIPTQAPPGQSGSFKRRSLKLKKTGGRQTKHRSSTVDDSDDGPSGTSGSLDPNNAIKRAESIRGKRRASGISEKSDASEGRADASGDESPGILSDEGQPESPTDALQADDKDIVKNMPWIRVVVGLLNSLDFECTHHHYCQPNCYQRQMRACSRLVKAVARIYEYDGTEAAPAKAVVQAADDKEDAMRKEKKLKKMVLTGPGSPVSFAIKLLYCSSFNADCT